MDDTQAELELERSKNGKAKSRQRWLQTIMTLVRDLKDQKAAGERRSDGLCRRYVASRTVVPSEVVHECATT